jgi:hypothetical protein
MSQAGTLLSDLGNGPSPGNDSDLVQQILADMNNAPPNPVVQTNHNMHGMPNQMGHGHAHGPPPQNQGPPQGHRQQMMNAQQPHQSTYPQAADPNVPTAHMIGRNHPTEADFNRMMFASQGQGQGMQGAPYMPIHQMQQMQLPPQQQPPAKNWIGDAADEFKMPLLVAIVCLLVTLPAVNLLVSHYAPWLLRPGGDMNTYGLIFRSLIAGLLFWFLQRVVAPLLI